MNDRLKRSAPLLLGILLIALPLLLAPTPAIAADDEFEPTQRPFLWKVEGPGLARPSWLFGTIHVGHPSVTTLHPAVEEAHEQADAVYCELKLDPHSQMQMALQMMNDEGETLESILPAELYAQLEAHLRDRGMGLTAMQRMRVWAIEMQVSLLDEMELVSGTALDQVLYTKAKSMKKEVGGIETMEEQFAIFDGMTVEEQIQSLQETLDELEKYKSEGRRPLAELLAIYLEGDSEKLLAKMNEDFDPEDPEDVALMKRLLDDRNVHMAERSAKKMKDAPDKSFFFAYGTAHMPGKKGVVELLRKDGYKVTRFVPEAAETRKRKLEPAR